MVHSTSNLSLTRVNIGLTLYIAVHVNTLIVLIPKSIESISVFWHKVVKNVHSTFLFSGIIKSADLFSPLDGAKCSLAAGMGQWSESKKSQKMRCGLNIMIITCRGRGFWWWATANCSNNLNFQSNFSQFGFNKSITTNWSVVDKSSKRCVKTVQIRLKTFIICLRCVHKNWIK